MMTKPLGLALLGLIVVGLCGCTYLSRPLLGAGGELTIHSSETGNDTAVALAADTSVYAAHDAQTLHVLLVSGPIDAPARVMHIQMFWHPKAARTPLDPSATNATVRLIVFDGDDGVCIYGGGGHLWPSRTAGAEHWRGLLRNATMRPLNATEGYNDPLGICEAAGSVTAQRDEDQTLALLGRVEQMVEDRLGYPLMLGRAD